MKLEPSASGDGVIAITDAGTRVVADMATKDGSDLKLGYDGVYLVEIPLGDPAVVGEARTAFRRAKQYGESWSTEGS